MFIMFEKSAQSCDYILEAKLGEPTETADAAYLSLQCALPWINDLVNDSVFHAKTDDTLISPLQHQKKTGKAAIQHECLVLESRTQII